MYLRSLKATTSMETTAGSVECWVYGEDVSRRFDVVLSDTNITIKAFKELIKKKQFDKFREVQADSLDLYSIPISDGDGDGDEKIISTWTPRDKLRLPPRLKVSKFQTSLVVVVDPRGPDSTSIQTHRAPTFDPNLTLNCWVRGHAVGRIFPVEISRSKTVGALREAIKGKKPVDFCDVDADALSLYKASVPCDESLAGRLESLTLGNKPALLPWDMLCDVFPGTHPGKYVDLIVQPPIAGEPHKSFFMYHLPASTNRGGILLHPISETDHPPANLPFANPRYDYILAMESIAAKSPSTQGEAANFKALQSSNRLRVHWTRPQPSHSSIPTRLLDPILGNFARDCFTGQPTKEDYALFDALNAEMPTFFEDERRRQDKITDIFRSHGIGIAPSSIQRYITDGDLHILGLRYVILEIKNEISVKGAEPYCQAICYYLRANLCEVKKYMQDEVQFNFPCLLLTVFGAHISFTGAVWADRPSYETLTPGLLLFSSQNHEEMRDFSARHFYAFRKARESLKKLYTKFSSNPAHFKGLQPEFPHPRCYKSLDGGEVHFRYVRRLEINKLLFVARTDAGEEFCVKFVQRYSIEAHHECAKRGFSPKLRGVLEVAGGWRMVAMDLLHDHDCLHGEKHRFSEDQKDRIREELRSKLVELHQMNFVHGDVRDANVMVARGGWGWKLIDFDWSGEIGKVKYPMGLNRGGGLKRPESVDDDRLIRAEHDIEMLNFLF